MAAVASAAWVSGLPTHRQCTVEIANECTSHTLENPRTHFKSGSCAVPLPPTIGPQNKGDALFIKTAHTACGAVGVFTYDLVSDDGSRDKMAVMYSVPYDFNIFSNWYALGIFGENTPCDLNLYDKMYNSHEVKFVRGKAKGPSLTYKNGGVTIRATMADSYTPVLRVVLSES